MPTFFVCPVCHHPARFSHVLSNLSPSLRDALRSLYETLFYRLYETIFHRVHGTPIVVLSVTMDITKFGTRHAFGSRKRQMKLVRMAQLVHAPTRGDSRIDASGGAASASSLQDNDCIDAYRDVEIATPSAQDSVVTSEAGVGVSCSSAPDASHSLTAVITAPNSATASSTVHLKTRFRTC